ICDGTDAFVPTVMEHIEYAGIHSGDSAAMIPPLGISAETQRTIEDYTRRIAIELGAVGLMNVQYAIGDDGVVYVLEANPRASRTVPLVSKVCGINMAGLATRVMLGTRIADLGLTRREIPYVGIKEAVFPFNMFPEVDPLLGPEMRSTGEVLGLGSTAGLAFFRAEEAANAALPTSGAVLLTFAERDRRGEDADTPGGQIVQAAQTFVSAGMTIRATGGTAQFLARHGIESRTILKIHEGRPNIQDAIINGDIQLVVNTPSGTTSEHDDSYIRKAAIRARVPYITTTTAALAAAHGIKAAKNGKDEILSLQDYHALLE
ncbi:MAG: carbamoyl phosphate synthase large subunit, partial [Brooklawnia sp.]|nr:carbamoyl phosphate synthase large subunit [Brooklawnia sp.]